MYIHSAVVNLAYEALVLILILSMPPILISLILGLIVAIFQAATQIQEQNLAFTVKLLAVIFTLLLMGGYLGGHIFQYGYNIFNNIDKLVRP